MATDRTPLLTSITNTVTGGSSARRDYYPPHPEISIRTTFTPWRFIPQTLLMWIRIIFAILFTVVLGVDIFQENKYGRYDKHLKLKAFFFYLSNLSWILQMVYYWLTAYWTILEQRDVDSVYRSERHINHRRPLWKKFVYWVDHVPQGEHHRYTRFIFSFFYTLTVTVPFVVSAGYWAMVFHEKHVKDHTLKAFCIVAVHGANSVVALLEIFFLNSQERQEPLLAHMFMLLVFGIAYYAWLWAGKALIGVWVYKFVDPKHHGRQEVGQAVLAGFAVAYVAFLFQYALHGWKHFLSKRYGVESRR